MRRPTLILTTIVVGLFLAACAAPSGSPGSSDGGNGSSQGQPAQTDGPASSDGGSGGNGGNGGTGANGSVTYEITGDVQASGELPFINVLGGYYFQQEGVTYMPFAESEDTSGEVVFITLSADGNIFAYGNGTVAIPAAECDWNVTRNDDSGATGSFTCNDVFAVTETGMGTVDVQGEFDAHN